ncbi:PriCT-2 domain-containing protein [Flavobacteriales bacterium]|nr:PriCT-2 domain-containing protein [Flavobacteriales bacterium]
MKNKNDLKTFPDWFDNSVSYFETVKSIRPITVPLKKWLQSIVAPISADEMKSVELVKQYRKSGNKDIKLKLPAFCPGALMKSRNASLPEGQRIGHLTGWMQFDIDAKDNPHIESATQLRDALAKITYTAFSSLSTSGEGVWGLIKVEDTKNYRAYFEQLKLDYKAFGISLDPTKGGNPTDLRYYTYDPDAYIADELRVYDRWLKIPERKVVTSRKPADASDNWERVNEALTEINNKGLDIAPSYDQYVKLGFALAHEFGEGGRDLFHRACQPSSKYNKADADKQFSACLKSGSSGISIGTFFYFYKEAAKC